MKIKTFGPVDERSLDQLKRCMEAGDAEFGVLCADHHPGYSQPIGGGIAYEGYVSPSGVGYDIGCLATGTRVTTMDGYALPIETVTSAATVACVDRGSTRCVHPNLGAVDRGRRALQLLRLGNGRELRLTPDHRVRTRTGWLAVSQLDLEDEVLCNPFIGLPYEPCDLDPALVRLLACVSGDGHLSRDGKKASAYTTVEEDAAALVDDARRLGYRPRVYRRTRRAGYRTEIHVQISSKALHARLADLGSPIGRKRWPAKPMRWLLDAPDWIRAQYLSAFASSEMSTPRLLDGRMVNLALKQADVRAAAFVAELLGSLGFRCSLAPSGSAYVVQILGGEDEQLRFLEQIGFCLAAEKRRAAALAASVAWQRRALLAVREAARIETRMLRAAGMTHRAVIADVSARFDVHPGFVHHAAYTDRPLRRGIGVTSVPAVDGEACWVPVMEVESAGAEKAWDVVTGDPAQSFLAEGVVVHNCGNKAVRTGLTRADLDALGGVERIMGEITRRISFGMGVPATERADHPVLEKIRNAEFEPQRKLSQLAESQLGTVGSGNHFVNVFENEDGLIWIGVHFGSRGFGHKTASGFLALAQGLAFDARAKEGEMDSPPILFPIDSELGRSYIAAMDLALEYAYAGRDVVVAKVLEILGAEATYDVHNNHNYGGFEEHFGRTYWVVRKGCTPARPGQEGFVGGSMGDDSVILEGVEGTEGEEALYSTVHGAGRVMSRSQAAGRIRRRKRVVDGRKVWVAEQIKPGVVDWPAVQARLRQQGIVLVGGGADEAPEVYKRLPEVLAAHAGSARVKHRLRPLGVAMAGVDVYDPYKD